MEAIVHISTLTPSTLTRPRGEAAGKKMVAYIQEAGAVELDLSDTSPSLSFLDGFVLTLQEEHVLHLVTFISTDPVVHSRLARIAGGRDVTIYMRPGDAHPKAPIVPMQSFELDQHLEQTRAHSKFAQI
jgi:hypothetical protein